MWETGNHICAEHLCYKEGFEEFVMNYPIIMMTSDSVNHVLFHRLSCSPPYCTSTGQWVQRAPQAKRAAKAEAKEWKVAELWLSILKASVNAAERVGADSKLTQEKGGGNLVPAPAARGSRNWIVTFIGNLIFAMIPKQWAHALPLTLVWIAKSVLKEITSCRSFREPEFNPPSESIQLCI